MPANLVFDEAQPAGDEHQRHRQKIARITLDAIGQFVGLLDADGLVVDINRHTLDLAGVSLSDVEGKPFWATPWWQVSEAVNVALKDVLQRAARGESVRWQTEIQPCADDSKTISIDASLTPIRDDDGNVVFIAMEGRDITEKEAYERENGRLRDELAALKAGINRSETAASPALPEGAWHGALAALRESEERFRAFVTASSDVVYSMSPDWLEMRHLDGKDFIPTTVEPSQTWLTQYIHPDDQPVVIAAINKAISTKSIFELEHRVKRVDGTLGWTFSRAIPLLDAKGELVEWFGAASDVTLRKRHEQHQRMLLNELNHRVKNTLATVQSIAKQTLRNAASLAESREVFDARLIALSKAHNVLTRELWEGAALREIVREALAAHSSDAGEHRLRFEGPEIRLQPRAALALSMALHELATNAIKYGALSNEAGEVEIRWWIGEDLAYFHLLWTEMGGPPVAIPLRRGFGSRLIEQGLSQDLAGDVRLEFAPQGVVCTITAPLDELRVNLEEPSLLDVVHVSGLEA